jgi:hypothetical protein
LENIEMSGTSTLVARTPKADELLAADAAAAKLALEAGNKMDAARKAAFAEVELLGEQWALGAGSLTRAAWDFASKVADRTFAISDAKAVYLAVVAGFNRTAKAKALGVDTLPVGDKEIASPVSIFATFGKRGPVAQGVGLYARVIVVRNTIADSKVQSAYNCMVTVNRRIEDATAKLDTAALAAFKVSDADILAWITPKATAAKSALAKLEAVIATLTKMSETGDYPALDREVEHLVTYAGKFAKALGKVEGEQTIVSGKQPDAETKH